jgi:hypothetical protein
MGLIPWVGFIRRISQLLSSIMAGGVYFERFKFGELDIKY